MATVALGLLAAACSSSGPTTSPTTGTATGVTTTSASVASTGVAARVPEGYPSVVVEVTAADRTTSEWCVLLAADARARSRGLMEVDSLGRFDGMLFDFDAPTDGQFYMLRTRIPLTVAFFNATSFISSVDMEPCPEDDNDPACPLYGADDLYDVALEVPLGGLARLGVGPGSQLRALDRTC